MADQPSSLSQPQLVPSTTAPMRLKLEVTSENSSTISEASSISPSLSNTSTSNSSFLFAQTSSLSSLNSSSSETRNNGPPDGVIRGVFGADLATRQTAEGVCLPPKSFEGLRRMGHTHQSLRAPRNGQSGVIAQKMELPCTVRLLDGEERFLPADLRQEYTNFRLRTVNMTSSIVAPPNRTVDYNVCENYFADGHRCLGDAFEACHTPPPYRSHTTSDVIPSTKASSDSTTSSSKSSKIKEVVKSLVGYVTTRPSSRRMKEAKSKVRSSSCSNDLCCEENEGRSNKTKSKAVKMTSRQVSPPARLRQISTTNVVVSQSFTEAPPTYDAVMKEQLPGEERTKRS